MIHIRCSAQKILIETSPELLEAFVGVQETGDKLAESVVSEYAEWFDAQMLHRNQG